MIPKKIKYMYYDLVPYWWRPNKLWYRLKCFMWHRYTTVKPRTLKYHTWCDRDALLAHTCFEILSRFLEEECSPGVVDWYHTDEKHNFEGYKIEVNGEKIWVIDEMWNLYNWWHNIYNKEYKEKTAEYCDAGLYDKANELEHQIEYVELPEMLHRLVNITSYMWT